MAITNLTNTKWLINESPNLQDYSALGEQYYLNFTSYNNNFTSIYLGHDGPEGNVIRYTGGVYAYYEDRPNSWTNEAYRTIEITGGTDATNATLIAWLTANATQLPVTTSIIIGANTLLGVDTIKVQDSVDTTQYKDFIYGATPSSTTSIKLGNNTLNGVNQISVMGTDDTYKSFGYVAQSGGTISLRGIGNSDTSADSYYSYIKINEAPTTAQDYDYMVTGRGYVNSKTQSQITQPVIIEGASVAYLWCDYNANFTCQYKVDNGSYQNLTPFSSPTTLTLTNDIELTLTGWRD